MATVDAGSLLAVTGLGVASGENVEPTAEGEHADAALDALEIVLSTPESGEEDDAGGPGYTYRRREYTTMMHVLQGTGATPLAGVGTAVWYDPDVDLPEEPDPDAVDPERERERFERARATAREELQREREHTAETVGEQEAAVFDAHIQFVEDSQIEESVTAAIEDATAAEHAVHDAFADHIEQFEGMEGRMAERADDLRDVRDRLVRVLVGADRIDLGSLPEGSVLLAERLSPSETAQLDPDRLAGFATVHGGRTSHAAIFARSLAIPAVVGVGEALLEVAADTEVLVDGDAGEVLINPDEQARGRIGAGLDVPVRETPVATADGHPIEVAANVGTAAELEPAADRGADGIGLLRTEFLFLDRETPPDEDEQREVYERALATFPDGRVVVRTLDVGGDKPIPYLDQPEESNPFLGERGVRRSLGRDEGLFETQLRALLRAAAGDDGGDLSVMFPLVATVEEVEAALSAVDRVAADLEAEGVTHAVPELGAMVETPAAVFVGPELAAHLEFLSIGTNDLTQYVMAADRENDRVADLHDPLHPPVLRAIRRSVEAAHEGDAWIGMCGEMAGDPAVTELLVGLGLDELSMSAVTIPAVKERIVGTDRAAARDLADRALAAGTREAVQALLADRAPGDDSGERPPQ